MQATWPSFNRLKHLTFQSNRLIRKAKRGVSCWIVWHVQLAALWYQNRCCILLLLYALWGLRKSSQRAQSRSQCLSPKVLHAGKRALKHSRNIMKVNVTVRSAHMILMSCTVKNMKRRWQKIVKCWGDGNESDSNFTQLLQLRGKELTHGWTRRETSTPHLKSKTSACSWWHYIIMLCQTSHKLAGSHCFSILADECTDCSNKEQFTINIRWVDPHLNEHKDFIGSTRWTQLSLVSSFKDVLLRMNAKTCRLSWAVLWWGNKYEWCKQRDCCNHHTGTKPISLLIFGV